MEIKLFAVWVTLQVRSEGRTGFLAAIEENARASVREEPGCLRFDVIELDRDENLFAFYELYRDEDAFHREHKGAAHFAAWRAVAERVLVPGSQINTFGHVAVSEPAAPSGWPA